LFAVCLHSSRRACLFCACKQAQGSLSVTSARAVYIEQAHPLSTPLPLWSRRRAYPPSRVGRRRCLSLSLRSVLQPRLSKHGRDTPLYASEGCFFALSRPSGRGNGSPAVFRHPLLLGRLKTRRNCWCFAGVLLANCLHSACIRAPFFVAGSVRRFAPPALRSNTLSRERIAAPQALKYPAMRPSAPLWDVLGPSIGVLCLVLFARVLEACGASPAAFLFRYVPLRT